MKRKNSKKERFLEKKVIETVLLHGFVFSATTSAMRVLLLGKTGLLGSEFFDLFAEREDIELTAPNHRELDLLDVASVDSLLAGAFFDRIINCVGYTKVDLAETERGRCRQLNVKVMETLLGHGQPITRKAQQLKRHLRDEARERD